MTTKSSFYYEANKLWIELETWTDLIGDKSPVALYSLKAAATEIIQRGGTFIINEANRGVHRSCNRMTDFIELMREVDELRRQNGLQAL